MSYPGYPPHQGPGGHQPPYPQGPPYPPGGGYPYPSNSAPYPQQGGVFPPSLGFGVNAPIYMPQSYPPQHHQPSQHHQSPQHNQYPQHHQPPQNPQPPFGGQAVYPPASYPAGTYPSTPQGYPHTQTDSNNAQTRPSYIPPTTVGKPQAMARPTVHPANPFNPTSDAEILRKAMKGFGTDEPAIIGVLTRRTNAQRMEIAVSFKTLYGKDLVKDLKSETSGNFKKLLVALMTPLPQLYARNLREAMSGLGTDEDVLIEVLCTKTNAEIRTIRAAYQNEYRNCLEDDLRSDTSGTFKRVMVSLCNAGRDENMITNIGEARLDAQRLMEAGTLKWGTDESEFNMILCQRNYSQLQLIFEEYEKMSGRKMEDTIRSEFSGNSEDAFLAIVRCVRSRPLFFAKCIRDAISGLGTKDQKLIRICATRCEVDMADIKQVYASKYGESLADAITGDTTGDYKRCLLALIGE